MTQPPPRKLEIEIARLRALYSTTVYSYARTRKEMKRAIYSGTLDPDEPVLGRPSDPKSMAANSGRSFLTRMKSQFPRYLRETIFVRLISALEVFIVDVVRELFVNRRDLFHTNKTFEFSQREILAATKVTTLWTKIISRELRTIQNQGFSKTMRYLNKRLGMDLGRSPTGIRVLEELHDRRHLLVHRLGRTDPQYRHTYNVTMRTLTVDESYLLEAFDHVLSFSNHLWSESSKLIVQQLDDGAAYPECAVQIEYETKTNSGEFLVSRDFHFESDDRIISLSEMVAVRDCKDGKYYLTLKGESVIVKDYLKRIRKAAKNGDIVLHRKWNVHGNYRIKHCRLSRTQIEAIARLLPKQPWPHGMHKQIASEQKISNSQVAAAIDIILADPKLLGLNGVEKLA